VIHESRFPKPVPHFPQGPGAGGNRILQWPERKREYAESLTKTCDGLPPGSYRPGQWEYAR
jgi:hypothetical protein